MTSRYPELFAWTEVPVGFRFPGGESYADLVERAIARRWDDSRPPRRRDDRVVAHGGMIRSVLTPCSGCREADLFRISLSYGGISVVDWIDERPGRALVNGDRLPASL